MSSRLGRKLITINAVMIILTAFSIFVSTILMVRSETTGLMLETCRGMLDQSMTEQSSRICNAVRQWDSTGLLERALNNRDYSEIDLVWGAWQRNENDFAAIVDRSGKLVWSSPSYVGRESPLRLEDAMVGKITNGIVNDSVLALEYAAPIYSHSDEFMGACLVGMDLAETSYLDMINEGTDASVTLFRGNVRYATTILDDNGERAIGTSMSENIRKIVLENDQRFRGDVDILGVSHYVLYGAMHDVNRNVVGAYFVGFPSGQFNAVFNTAVVACAILSIIAVVIAGWVLTYSVKKMILKPVNAANVIAFHMISGDLTADDTKFKFSKDEIGQFAESIEGSRHTIHEYVKDISRVLAAMAGGDFTAVTKVRYLGDFRNIKRSFIGIRESINRLLRGINESAESVMSGSSQIADASQMLAEGTDKQASAIDELSDSIKDISHEVSNSAANAAEADRLSQECQEKIELQNREMESMLSAMAEIEQKSIEINEIIKTIEDIAFQTNILALNASIEASKAGEAGKGFSVVAEEVRNLAGKSAEAASSTNELIAATIQAVNNGSRIAESTATVMKEVVDISSQTSSLITQISAAAASEDQSIGRITDGVERISMVVQQNSATAEETAASCQELSGQSKQLKEQISALHVDIL